MTDDLVKRLRALARGEPDDLSLGDDAADRIEALEAVVGALNADLTQARRRRDAPRCAAQCRGPSVAGCPRGTDRQPRKGGKTMSFISERRRVENMWAAMFAPGKYLNCKSHALSDTSKMERNQANASLVTEAMKLALKGFNVQLKCTNGDWFEISISESEKPTRKMLAEVMSELADLRKIVAALENKAPQ